VDEQRKKKAIYERLTRKRKKQAASAGILIRERGTN